MTYPEAATGAKTRLGELLESRVARFSTRKYDWDALKFQADFDPKYRRAQMRYVGTGGTGVKADASVVSAEHFTFSTMILPAGAEGPLHVHNDVEEVFFVLRGKVKLIAELDGERWETIVGERDLISWPPGVYRGEVNIGEEDALMCVMLGSDKCCSYNRIYKWFYIKRCNSNFELCLGFW